MMKKDKLPLLLASVFIVAVAFGAYQLLQHRTPPSPSEPLQLSQVTDHTLVNARLGKKQLRLEVVNTPSSITQGLSGRPTLGADGMLFVLPKRMVPTFWMLDMKFDLDLVWLDGATIVDITPNVPHPLEEDLSPVNSQQLPTYSPKVPANMVLEIEAGKAQEWGIGIGDKLTVTSET